MTIIFATITISATDVNRTQDMSVVIRYQHHVSNNNYENVFVVKHHFKRCNASLYIIFFI